ncbi:MAG: BC1872 family protein [Thermincolia bacterium]
MTRDEVLNMKPGRELDALVAEKVMGERVRSRGQLESCIMPGANKPWRAIPNYSTDISASWEVIETLASVFRMLERVPLISQYTCTVWPDNLLKPIKVNAPTAPEAICKAALLVCLRDGE